MGQLKRGAEELENASLSVPKRAHTQLQSRHRALAQPLGNHLLQSTPYNARSPGLGRLAVLPDEIVASIFSELLAVDAIRCQGVSRAFFAFSRIEGHWKLEYIKRSRGALGAWKGRWRTTYIGAFLRPPGNTGALPTDSIENRDLFSDVLYLPHLASSYDANTISNASSFSDNIPRKNGRLLSSSDLGQEPVIASGLMDNWPALPSKTTPGWSLSTIASRFPRTEFRAEAVLTTMEQYEIYHDTCTSDESPLYIFDAEFVEKSQREKGDAGMAADFEVPPVFRDDLFKVLGKERPNYRWLVGSPGAHGSLGVICSLRRLDSRPRTLWVYFPLRPKWNLCLECRCDRSQTMDPVPARYYSAGYHGIRRPFRSRSPFIISRVDAQLLPPSQVNLRTTGKRSPFARKDAGGYL